MGMEGGEGREGRKEEWGGQEDEGGESRGEKEERKGGHGIEDSRGQQEELVAESHMTCD